MGRSFSRENFSGRVDFSLWVNMGSDPIPPRTLSDESINWGLVCTHMHSIGWTQKILTFMSWTSECRPQKLIQYTPSSKMECDYLNGWIKRWSHSQNLTQNSEPIYCLFIYNIISEVHCKWLMVELLLLSGFFFIFFLVSFVLFWYLLSWLVCMCLFACLFLL